MQHHHPIFVSLTSVNFRIQRIEPVLRSILEQSVPPDRVVLYLSKEPYLLDEGVRPRDLPLALKEFERTGKIEIEYTKNTGPYRKLLPILRANRAKDCIIVTADDDTIYPENWLSNLYSEYLKRQVVVGSSGHTMTVDDQGLIPYQKWGLANESNLLANFAIGKDGILYSPKFFDDWIDRDDFLHICPYADDVWFKFLTLRTGTGTYIQRNGEKMFPCISGSGYPALWNTNRVENDPQIKAAIDYFGIDVGKCCQ